METRIRTRVSANAA